MVVEDLSQTTQGMGERKLACIFGFKNLIFYVFPRHWDCEAMSFSLGV